MEKLVAAGVQLEDLKNKEIYKVETKQVENLAGFVEKSARSGETVPVIRRAFLTSFDQFHTKIMGEAVRQFVGHERDINNLLVVIRGDVANIYRKFPITLLIRTKADIKQYHAVFKNQILDIEGVQFKDIYFNLDVQDGDKFLWLFRNEFSFGLYFDFSGEMKAEELSPTLGKCYRSLEYYAICSYFKESNNAKILYSKGWFPFIQLIGDELERLISVNSEDMDIVVESIIKGFTKEKIESFTNYWYSNTIFAGKKKLINAGIAAFLSNTEEGSINCIKNLVPEIEGVIRLSYHKDNSKKPTTEELKNYLIKKAKQKFSNDDSFGFTGLFADYLNNVIFKGFDVEKNLVDFSRHSVGHGVANDDLFTRERALQCILTLDQIYFYLGKTEAETKMDFPSKD